MAKNGPMVSAITKKIAKKWPEGARSGKNGKKSQNDEND